MANVRILITFLLIQHLNEIVIVFSYNVTVSLKLNVKKTEKEFSMCRKEVCNKTANDLLKLINLDADPCKDFFKFACGQFIKIKIPKNRFSIGTTDDIYDKVQENLRIVLEEGLNETNDNFAVQTKLSFQSCLNTSYIDQTDIQTTYTALVGKFGGWPLVEGDKWNEKYDLTSLLVKLQLHKMLGLFDLDFREADNSVNFNVPVMLVPQLPLPLDYYRKNVTGRTEALSKYILNITLSLGNMKKSAKILNDVNDTVRFAFELAQCVIDNGTLIKSRYRVVSLSKLKEQFKKSLNFETFFKSTFKEVNKNIMPQENIGFLASTMPYFNCLAKLLESTPKRNVVNYLIWNMVEQSMIAMPSQIGEITSTFKQSRSSKPRWRICIDTINQYLDQAVGYLYKTRQFKYTDKVKVLGLISYLKKSYSKMISKQNWITPGTKTQALKQLKDMKDYVGYPDYLENAKLLVDEFNGMDFSEKTFVEIFHTMRFMKMKKQMKLLKTRNTRDSAPVPVTMVNAFYDNRLNRIVFPAGILTMPLYSGSRQMYLNFGGIGSVIGHEITHGFDDTDIKNTTYISWNDQERKVFASKSECFIRQYGDLTLEQTNKKVNGSFTLRENIADAGGLRIAHMGYKNWLRKNGEEEQLIGLPYNSEQMFFIAYARNYCQKRTPENAINNLKTNLHAPNMFRVNIPLKNMMEFSAAFQCKRDSEMTLSKRCRLW